MEAYPGLEKELAFTIAEYESRLKRIQQLMATKGLDTLLVQHPANVVYISGYQSKITYYNETVVIPADGKPILLVLDWEEATARLHSWPDQIETFPGLQAFPIQLASLLERLGLDNGRIGVETKSWAVTAYLHKALEQALPVAKLIDASGLVEAIKVVKSETEIKYIREAGRITDLGVSAAIDAAAPGRTDNDVAAAAYEAMIGGGSEFMSVGICVLSGRRSGIIHASHKRHEIKVGDPIVLEMGAIYQRYVAPLQRTISIGTPSEGLERLSLASFTAIEDVLSLLRPNADQAAIANRVRSRLEEAGPDAWAHGGVAYAVGLAFPPSWVEGSHYIGGTNPMGAGANNPIKAGMVFHLPLSLRVPGRYGVMQSETVIVTEEGCEALSTVDRRLFIK
mgnify:CR=1 FL=1